MLMKHSYKVVLCAATHNQPSDEWIKAVDELGVDVIITYDSWYKTIDLKLPERWEVYDYEKQESILGDDYEYFKNFHKSSAVKNFGHFLAWNGEYDIIMGLDNDCIPGRDFVEQHIKNLEMDSYTWENPLSNTEWFSRGFPYSARKAKTALSMGLWTNELDLYGTDRVQYPDRQTTAPMFHGTRVAQNYIPLSGMNWATWRENIPDLLFLPYMDGFKRADDIWGGYIFQKKMQERNQRIVYGLPFVFHDTVVNPQEDADDEVKMIEWEDRFFDSIDCDDPWPWVREALTFWESLFELCYMPNCKKHGSPYCDEHDAP